MGTAASRQSLLPPQLTAIPLRCRKGRFQSAHTGTAGPGHALAAIPTSGLPSRGRPMLAGAPCRAAPLCQLMLHAVMTHGQQMSQRGRLKESHLWATEWLDSRLALSDQPRHEQSHGRQPRRLVHAVERTRFGYQKALFKSGQTVFTSQRT